MTSFNSNISTFHCIDIWKDAVNICGQTLHFDNIGLESEIRVEMKPQRRCNSSEVFCYKSKSAMSPKEIQVFFERINNLYMKFEKFGWVLLSSTSNPLRDRGLKYIKVFGII